MSYSWPGRIALNEYCKRYLFQLCIHKTNTNNYTGRHCTLFTTNSKSTFLTRIATKLRNSVLVVLAVFYISNQIPNSCSFPLGQFPRLLYSPSNSNLCCSIRDKWKETASHNDSRVCFNISN